MKTCLEFIALLITITVPIYWAITDFRKNILTILFLLIYGTYVVWPLIFIHELSVNYDLNIQVEEYVQQGLVLDNIFMIVFILVYQYYMRDNFLKSCFAKPLFFKTHKVVLFLYITFFCLIFFNNAVAGIDLVGKWLGYANHKTYGVEGLTFYLQNLVDSLIVLTLMAYATNMRRIFFVLMLLGDLFFIVPFGFRYRIIYLILGLLILFIHKNEFNLKNLFSAAVLSVLISGTFLFLTSNRDIIVGNAPGESFRYKLINQTQLVSQIRGAYVDLAIYKGIDQEFIFHDFGKSFFYYIPVRVLPASFFEGGIKPYPPLLMRDTDKVLNLTSPIDCPGCRTGEAQTIMGSIYYSFGVWGAIAIPGILGCVLGFHAKRKSTNLSIMWGICTLLALFTFITRGYFPQFIDNLAYLALPLVIIQIVIIYNRRKLDSNKIL